MEKNINLRLRNEQVPVPANEAQRLSFLHNLRLDPLVPIKEIQGLCEVASKVANAPIALISLIDKTQQNFLASVGVGDLQTSDRDISFCAHAIMNSQQLEITDARLDPKFCENPYVVGTLGVRSYLGTVLEPEPDMRIGTMCVLDTKPRSYSDDVKVSLNHIGLAISAILVSYREKIDLVKYTKQIEKHNVEILDLNLSLEAAVKNLVTAEKIKSDFLAVISHELRTPLTSIKGSLALMKIPSVLADTQKAQRLVNIASDSGDRLLSLIEDMLELQKDNFSKSEFTSDVIDLSEIINTAADTYRNHGIEKKLTLTVSGTENSCMVAGNKVQLTKVLESIISNAFKFSERDGKIYINLRCLSCGPQISIEDNGVGIPEGSKEKVFGFFSQVDNSDTRSKNGAGLGLHICKEILKQHNATIDYKSELGVGTTFFVTFPAKVSSI